MCSHESTDRVPRSWWTFRVHGDECFIKDATVWYIELHAQLRMQAYGTLLDSFCDIAESRLQKRRTIKLYSVLSLKLNNVKERSYHNKGTSTSFISSHLNWVGYTDSLQESLVKSKRSYPCSFHLAHTIFRRRPTFRVSWRHRLASTVLATAGYFSGFQTTGVNQPLGAPFLPSLLISLRSKSTLI